VGFEPKRLIENRQVIDFTDRRKGRKGRNGGCLYNSVQFSGGKLRSNGGNFNVFVQLENEWKTMARCWDNNNASELMSCFVPHYPPHS
jgi:hypothetical protein